MKARDHTDAQIVRHAWVMGRTTNPTISQLVASAFSLKLTKVEQCVQVKRMMMEQASVLGLPQLRPW